MQFPIINLLDQPFYIDDKNQSLRCVNYPSKELPLTGMSQHYVRPVGHVLRFLYDREKMAFAELSHVKGKIPDSVQLLEIKQRLIVNPPANNAKELLSMMGGSSQALYSNDENELIARVLPRRDILGTSFIYDTLNLELKELRDMSNRISFAELNVSGNGKVFFDYNVETKNVARPGDWDDSIAIAFLPPMQEVDVIPWSIMNPRELIEIKGNEYPKWTIKSRRKGKGL